MVDRTTGGLFLIAHDVKQRDPKLLGVQARAQPHARARMRQTRKAEMEVRTHASDGRNHARTELFLRGILRAFALLPIGGGLCPPPG